MEMIPCPHGSVWHWLVDCWMAVTVCGGIVIGYGKTIVQQIRGELCRVWMKLKR